MSSFVILSFATVSNRSGVGFRSISAGVVSPRAPSGVAATKVSSVVWAEGGTAGFIKAGDKG